MFRATLMCSWIAHAGMHEHSINAINSHDIDSLAVKCKEYRDECLRLTPYTNVRDMRVELVDVVRCSRVDPDEFSVVSEALE